MDEFDESMFPDVDIDAHLKMLRRLVPATDGEVLANATPRGIAVSAIYCNTAHTIADFIDAYRANGFSAGEAVQAIWDYMLDPIASVPVIATSSS